MRALFLVPLLFLLAHVSAKVSRLSHPHTYRKENPEAYINEADFSHAGYPPPQTHAPASNIWATLSNDEAASVIHWLHHHSSLNLTSATMAGPWDNTISVVDLLAPNKVRLLHHNP